MTSCQSARTSSNLLPGGLPVYPENSKHPLFAAMRKSLLITCCRLCEAAKRDLSVSPSQAGLSHQQDGIPVSGVSYGLVLLNSQLPLQHSVCPGSLIWRQASEHGGITWNCLCMLSPPVLNGAVLVFSEQLGRPQGCTFIKAVSTPFLSPAVNPPSHRVSHAKSNCERTNPSTNAALGCFVSLVPGSLHSVSSHSGAWSQSPS